MSPDRVCCIMGPTAVGKTDIAIELAKQFPFEIISVDSVMVYREMNIGTAKPHPEILSRIPHHLIDIRDPLDPYSAAEFVADVHQLIPHIINQHKIPLLVGGTFLYFQSLINGISPLPSADPAMRASIIAEAGHRGWQALHDDLSKIDPESAARIKPGDHQRLQRALEVYRLSGKTLTACFQSALPASPFHFFNMGIMPPNRTRLHNHIRQRFMTMLDQGFIDEVRDLYQRGDLHPGLPAIRACGYRQAWSFLAGEIDEQTFIEKAIISTRQLAKNQMTWLRSFPSVQLITENDPEKILNKMIMLLKNELIIP